MAQPIASTGMMAAELGVTPRAAQVNAYRVCASHATSVSISNRRTQDLTR
ncbi:MAG: hypothetical protein ACLPIG_08085 [Methylocella sp.]